MKLDLRDRNTQLGAALVALGLLALFGNLGLFSGLSRLFGLLLFGAAGVLVLAIYRRDRTRIWTLPVAFGLFGLAVASLDLPWSGGAFLGSIGLGFLSVWLVDATRQRWWALIPAGVLLTLGLVATYEEALGAPGELGGTVFFLGLAATFAALYLMPSVNQRWAIWPALALGVLAILTMSFSGGWVAPLALIAVGAWLLTRQSRPADVHTVTVPPADAKTADLDTDHVNTADATEMAPTGEEDAPRG